MHVIEARQQEHRTEEDRNTEIHDELTILMSFKRVAHLRDDQQGNETAEHKVERREDIHVPREQEVQELHDQDRRNHRHR